MKKKGFTLIELLAVIVILAIIAFIAIPVITNMVENSRKGAAESSALGYIDAIEKQIMIEKLKNNLSINDGEYDDVVEFNDDNNISVNGKLPTAGELAIEKGKVIEATICINGYTVEYDNEKAIAGDKCSTKIKRKNEGLLGKIENNKFTNDTVVNITANGKTYSAHVYNLKGNQTLSGENIYGTADDVATASREAVNMVILKVNGDLTINSGATVRPYYTEYGGPKGFVIYVTGKLTNNGTIDNSHGAKATGEDVYLWQNEDNSYEIVPALGATGGIGFSSSSYTYDSIGGYKGNDGSNRSTGGGGSGSFADITRGGGNRKTGNGGRGTSYSGGTGGGAAVGPTSSADGDSKGGQGGKTADSNSTFYPTGGVGNPGGTAYNNGTVTNGTGGLLVIYAKDIDNKATISANGTANVNNSTSTQKPYGGSSGGGSLNIFYGNNFNSTGTVSATGGAGLTSELKASSGYNACQAGAGGNGSITIGSIKTGNFVLNN